MLLSAYRQSLPSLGFAALSTRALVLQSARSLDSAGEAAASEEKKRESPHKDRRFIDKVRPYTSGGMHALLSISREHWSTSCCATTGPCPGYRRHWGCRVRQLHQAKQEGLCQAYTRWRAWWPGWGRHHRGLPIVRSPKER
jgi:hypothetical protein